MKVLKSKKEKNVLKNSVKKVMTTFDTFITSVNFDTEEQKVTIQHLVLPEVFESKVKELLVGTTFTYENFTFSNKSYLTIE